MPEASRVRLRRPKMPFPLQAPKARKRGGKPRERRRGVFLAPLAQGGVQVYVSARAFPQNTRYM